MECKFGKSHMPPNCSHVIRDHRVTKGVTSRTKPVLNLPSLQTRVGGFHLPSPSPRVSRCSSCPPPPRVLHQHPALRQRPWPLRAGLTPPHAALAPLTLRTGSTPAHAGSAPPPLCGTRWVDVPGLCALGQHPPLCALYGCTQPLHLHPCLC